jgi:mutator protein MutT
MTPKRIGIAVVECDGKYLVGIRGPDIPLAGFAEFPGGKSQIDETIFECVIRECLEETKLLVLPIRLLRRVEFEYPHGQVDLHFVICHPANKTDVRDDHEGFRWISVDELRTMKFPDANKDVVNLLVSGKTIP